MELPVIKGTILMRNGTVKFKKKKTKTTKTTDKYKGKAESN